MPDTRQQSFDEIYGPPENFPLSDSDFYVQERENELAY
jgi:hypothetical protein